LEDFVVSLEELPELVHISLLDTVDDLEVGRQWFLEISLVEERASRDLTHQQVDNDKKLLHLDAEADSADLRALAQGLNQASLSLRVLKLDSFDAADVVKIARELVVRA